ncbi:MAG: A/G-specific adenine glycosylase [Chloroflexota bacterium]|nr:A/G-specific adenine glycosylase [Chloroflexota bacterium]
MTEQHPSAPPAGQVMSFRESLLGWWEGNARELPWRKTRDPYRILVSEVMLQQTQVDRVIPYYHQWLQAFPDVHALAAAPTATVIRLWKGLGYNRRAVNLQRAAAAVVERGGQFPDTVVELRALPGIGPYTAGAIACFAFEQDVSFIDTNMRRVLHRVFVGSDVPERRASDREILGIAQAALPDGDAWRWNQALIEFGALQCTARTPACVICPAQTVCMARPRIHSDLQAANADRNGRSRAPVPFERTNRYFRGRIIDALREQDGGALSIEALGRMVKPDYSIEDQAWLQKLVVDLERDGLAVIAEDEPEYDAGEKPIRVSLP